MTETILITGSNRGIGLELAHQYKKGGSTLYSEFSECLSQNRIYHADDSPSFLRIQRVGMRRGVPTFVVVEIPAGSRCEFIFERKRKVNHTLST